MSETCKYKTLGQGVCGKPVVVSKFLAESQGFDLCEVGHLVVFDPKIKGGDCLVWRFE